MKNLNYLKEQLYFQINEYYKDQEKLQNLKLKVSIYKEIESVFDYDEWEDFKNSVVLLDIKITELYGEEANNLLNTLHILVSNVDKYAFKKDLENELYKELTKLNQIVQKIIFDSKSLYIEKENLFFKQKAKNKTILEYRKILVNLENNYVVSPYQLKLIYQLMENYEFTDKEQILIIEKIKNHNRNITIENYNKKETIITEILTKDLEQEEIEDIPELNNQVLSIYQSIIQEEIEIIEGYLPELETGLYTVEEYEYIYKKIMNLITKNMIDCQEELSKKETYQDVDLKNMFINEFLKLKNILGRVRYFYNSKKMQYEYKNKEDNQKENQVELLPSNNIYFSYPLGSDRSYMEKDIQKLPEEALGEVEKLLENFKYKKLTKNNIKGFNSNNTPLISYQELRGDQVRIVFKNIFENNYIFVGVGLKKKDNDRVFYRGCANRSLQINKEQLFNEELIKAQATYQKIMDYIEENKRKGNRYGRI